MIYVEAENSEDETKKLQKLYNYAKKEKWEGQMNDILKLAFKKNIKLH